MRKAKSYNTTERKMLKKTARMTKTMIARMNLGKNNDEK